MIIFVFQSSVVWICLSLGLVCVCTYLHGACVWGRIVDHSVCSNFRWRSSNHHWDMHSLCFLCFLLTYPHTYTCTVTCLSAQDLPLYWNIFWIYQKKKEKYRARLQLCIVANLPLCESPSVRDIIWRTLSSQQLRLSFYSSLSRIGAIGSHSIFIYLFLSPPIGPRIIKRRHPSDGGG